MIVLLATLCAWTLILVFARPKPSDLQAQIPSYPQSFKAIQATFWLGVFLIVTFFLFSDGTFNELNENWLIILGVNNLIFSPWWFVQTITSTFIHLDLRHLLLNVYFLALMSSYERMVKAKRFLAIFLFSSTLSSISVLFMSNPMVTAGASAGLLGLAAAYVLDKPELTLKEYLLGFGSLLFLLLVLSYTETSKTPTMPLVEVDTLGHLFGLIFGALFCKLFPRKVVNSL